MNVMFVSQCSKRALTETRRILDQFAERRGNRTWQTPITQAGLDTVRKLLRASARKNTAVACHWIRRHDHSELLWIVGDARQFNAEGAVPTDTTRSDVLRRDDENHWHALPLMTALTALAALMHDLGKATRAFQQRLATPGSRERNHYRHEWVSLRLLQAFVGNDDDAGWLQRLAASADESADVQAFERLWLDHADGRLLRDGLDTEETRDGPSSSHNPFRRLPPLAQAVAWLILTHHRLPCKPVRREDGPPVNADEDAASIWRPFGARLYSVNRKDLRDLLQQVNADWNEPRDPVDAVRLQNDWTFDHGLPVVMPIWRRQTARYARKLLQMTRAHDNDVLHDPFIMHVSRLCLMLADHHYSSIKDAERRKPWLSPRSDYPLYANTIHERHGQGSPGKPVYNQTLDEHLLGVQAHATLVACSLSSLTRNLPALQNHRGLKKRSADARFRWQDRAADLATSVRERAARQGAFIVNMASTGRGKTLGNARIMNALAHPATGLRCAFAIGLRTLTLQTGRAFQQDLGLGDDELAIRVGGAASRALFDYWEQRAEDTGSASAQALLADPPLPSENDATNAQEQFREDGILLYEGNDRHPLLQRLTDDPAVRKLIAAPILTCTIDHLTPATESLRGGRQIAPMLRLMSSDLVLDEPDDFDMADLPALTRLVHWAGLLGARVLLSSATLPPDLVHGLFLAYRTGRTVFQKHRGERPHETVSICCLWVDEFAADTHDCADGTSFRQRHEKFAQKRAAKLEQDEIRRLAQIVLLPEQQTFESHQPDSAAARSTRHTHWAGLLLREAWQLHQRPQNHVVDPASGKCVSFGLIRMANIGPLFDVARAMYTNGLMQNDVRVHLCVYHSQFPLLMRSTIEYELDIILKRPPNRDGSDPALQHASVRAVLNACPEQHQIFIVLGSPVTEVGRDHDYDWAVVEPSSMRSFIQLAGRVRRHRSGAINDVNLSVLDRNLRSFKSDDSKAAFCRPGFEMDKVSEDIVDENYSEPDTARFFHLRSHRLQNVLVKYTRGREQWPINATPRIRVDDDAFDPRTNLIDLEHARMHDTTLPHVDGEKLRTPPKRSASLHWHSREALWLTGILPQLQRFRYDSMSHMDVVLLPDENDEKLVFHQVKKGQRRGEFDCIPSENLRAQLRDDELFRAGDVTPWLQVDLMQALEHIAQEQALTLRSAAQRYATASLPVCHQNHQGWDWHPALGFNSRKD